MRGVLLPAATQDMSGAWSIGAPVVLDLLPEAGDGRLLDACRRLLGGWLESVPGIGSEALLLVNEEGKIDGLAFNPLAQIIWHELTDNAEFPQNDTLCGPAILFGRADAGGAGHAQDGLVELTARCFEALLTAVS